MALWGTKGLSNFVGTSYDYLTPGKGSNRLTDWSRGTKNTYTAPSVGVPASIKKPSTPPPSSTVQDSGDAAFMRDIMSQLASLRNSAPPTPRLATFSVMDNWQRAKSAAEKAVNPLYEKKLNQFLEGQQIKRAQKQKEFTLTRDTIQGDKAATLQENQVNRTRTGEDVAAAIQKIGVQEGQYQVDEGQQFDQNYRQTAEQLAATGMATTGIGKQQSSDMIRLRNVQNQRQLDEFKGQVEAKQLFKTRTFEDLARGDADANRLASNKLKAAQFDLDSYLEDLAIDEKNKRLDIELERMGAVYGATQEQEKLGVEQFLAGLVGQGYSAQDIAYNRQVYG